MKLVSWIAALLAAATLLPAAETPTATGQDMKIKVAVFDFSTIDTVGQKFYRYTEEKIPPMTYNQLNASDYGTIDDRMLGLVRLFENRATLLERQEERDRMNRINDRTLAMRDALAEKILNSPQRTTVIGAEYMLVALGEIAVFQRVKTGHDLCGAGHGKLRFFFFAKKNPLITAVHQNGSFGIKSRRCFRCE